MFIREEQWLQEIRQLADEVGVGGNRSLSYMSLPGEDLLDVRLVHDFCRLRKATLRYLGFNEQLSDRRQVALSRDKLNMPSLAPGFEILPHRFEMVGEDRTHQFQVLRRMGPFDVVNLDLCGTAESTTKPPLEKFHPALTSLMKVQHEKRTDSWLLLLTVRCTVGEVPKTDMDKYWCLLAENANRSAAFRSFLGRIFPSLDGMPESTPPTFDRDQNSLSSLFALSMGKWLVALSCTCLPKWSVALKSCYCYRVTGAAVPNMLSMAFTFSPQVVAPQDPVAFGGGQPPMPPQGDEVRLAEELLLSVGMTEDLDALLAADSGLHAKYSARAEALLEPSKYNVADFREYVRVRTASIAAKLDGAARCPYQDLL